LIGRIVEVATDGVHLSVSRGFMVVSQDHQKVGQVALDDIAALIVHGHGASYTANLSARLAERGAPMVICGSDHNPIALLWPLNGHYEQGKRMQAQAEAGQRLKNRLWRDLIKAKIIAQANALDACGGRGGAVRLLAGRVRTGDPDNREAEAARRYWRLILGPKFRRDRAAGGVNGILNYGYMVLRAATARSILAAGLHPSLSIHHQSRGSALRLADDLMEPFRPFVDTIAWRLLDNGVCDLDASVKANLVAVTTLDLLGPRGVSPLQVCLDRLAISLAQVYMGDADVLELPGPAMALTSATLPP